MGNGMGGGLGRRRKGTTKVMKIDGETFKLTTPTTALEVTNNHPNHLLYDSQSLKHFGLRAKPLDPHHPLQPKSLYFLLQLPPLPGHHRPLLRVHSSLHLTATDRLESLMLSRRSVSDLPILRPPSSAPTQVKFRLPRAEVERLMKECKDKAEVAERIVNLYVRDGDRRGGGDDDLPPSKTASACSRKAREKRVSFVQLKDGSTQ